MTEKDREKRKEIFWSRINIGSPDKCWEFKKYKNARGYGVFWDGRKQVLAHRYAYEIHNDYRLFGQEQVLHKCDNPSCCNPNHLYCGTVADNMHDKAIRSRISPAKYINGKTKLSANDVIEIKKLWAVRELNQSQIGKLFGISNRTVSNYLSGRSKHTRED